MHRRYLKQDNFDRHGTNPGWDQPQPNITGKRENEKITLDWVMVAVAVGGGVVAQIVECDGRRE